MMILFKFLIFFTYLTLIFVINNFVLFAFFSLAGLTIIKMLKINIKDFFKATIFLIPFLLLTFICNFWWGDIETAIIILIRLLLAYLGTYIFSRITPTGEIVRFVEIITKPLSIFKLDNKKAGLIVGIGISMIPILKDEIEQKMYALKSKGYKLKLNNLSIIFKPLFISILKRTGEIEKSLISKGYQE